jgi:hypothetical protein
MLPGIVAQGHTGAGEGAVLRDHYPARRTWKKTMVLSHDI